MRYIFDEVIEFSPSDLVTHQWGYSMQVTVFIRGVEDGGFVTTWPKSGGEPTLEQRIRRTLDRLSTYLIDREREHRQPPKEFMVRYQDVVSELVKKGYLKEGQRFEHLPDLTVPVPKRSVWRRIWDFLTRPVWG